MISPLQLFDARYAIEPTICRLCVLHAGKEDLKTLWGMVAAMENSSLDVSEFIGLDANFHCALSIATKNDFLISVANNLHFMRNQEVWSQKRKNSLTIGEIRNHIESHREIVEAIQQRDAKLASKQMKSHIRNAREAFYGTCLR